jgi:hypothetical protein
MFDASSTLPVTPHSRMALGPDASSVGCDASRRKRARNLLFFSRLTHAIARVRRRGSR